MVLAEQIAADRERLLGSDDPRTLRALAGLAVRYHEGAYDPPAAIALAERIINDAYHALGPDDPDVRALRAVLILAHTQAGRSGDVLALHARFPMAGDKE